MDAKPCTPSVARYACAGFGLLIEVTVSFCRLHTADYDLPVIRGLAIAESGATVGPGRALSDETARGAGSFSYLYR